MTELNLTITILSIILNTMILNATKKNNSYIAHVLKNDPDSIPFLKDGEIVEAKLLQRNPRLAYFDLGKFGTGAVYGVEFSNAKSILKELKIGEAISAKVLNAEDEDGHVELSLASAHHQKNWQKLKEVKDSNEPIIVKIIGANSGGLIANVNEIKAFLPVSQLAGEHYPRVDDADKSKILQELRKLVGEEIKVKILDINPRSEKLIISEKGTFENDLKELLTKYNAGDVVDCIVSGIADFGVFVKFIDNPAIEGLVHIAEIEYKVIDSPKEIVKIDEQIKAKITEIKDGRVFLSIKTLKADPWENINDKIKEGEKVEGIVYKFNPFGAYINLENNVQGMIHITNFGGAEEMKKVLELGKKYKFLIDSIKTEERRISLKMA